MVTFAQEGVVMIDEHFDGATMPAGWATFGAGTGNWSVSPTDHAGCGANEVNLRPNMPTFNGTAYFATPALNLNGVNSIIVQFKFYLDNYLGTQKIGIATSKDGGATWHQGWQQVYSTSKIYSVDELFSTSDLNNDNVLVAIYYTGNSEFFHNIYFDDIKVIALKNNDLGINKINVLDKIPMSDNTVSFTVTNNGHDVVNNFEAKYYFNDNEVVTETFNTNMASLDTRTFSFRVHKNLNPGAELCSVEITKVNGQPDDDTTNNSLKKDVFVGYGSTQRTVMIEHFSSCTCPHCPNADAVMATLTANNPDKFAYVKYEMDWPGLGDPYYTEEAGVMRTYYQVTGIPDLFFDSKDIYYQNVTQAIFDSLYASYAFADIKGWFTMSGSVINVVIDVTSHFDMSDYKLMVAVNEKTTTGNVREEFHHVMMKMLPDPYGTNINIASMETKRFEFTQDMSGTFVEEMDDLEVAVWIQKRETKEIINSHFMYENTTGINPVNGLQITDNEDNTVTVSWEQPDGNPTGYDLYLNGEHHFTTSTSLTLEVNPDTYNVAEVAVCYDKYCSVKRVVSMFVPMSIGENSVINVEVYPNPFENQFVIKGNDINEISIYDLSGRMVISRKYNSGNDVSISSENLNGGVYFIKITTGNGEVVKKAVKI